jgi:uncharacterized membrane protein
MHPFDLKSALLAKHAQHVVLVHFPIALFLTGVAFDFAGRWTRRKSLEAARISIFSPLLLLCYQFSQPAYWRGTGNSQDRD